MQRVAKMAGESFCFFAISDFGENNKIVKNVAGAMDRYARTVRPPSFVLGLGDNFYPYGVIDTSDPLFESVWRNVYLIYPSLRVPWKMVLGNHDYMGIPKAEVDYHYDIYHNYDKLWHMPDRNYEFSCTLSTPESCLNPPSPAPSSSLLNNPNMNLPDSITVDFFAIDTNACQGHVQRTYPGIKKTMKQDILRLHEKLLASTAHWKIAFGHHPLYTQGLGHLIPAKCLRLSQYETQRYDGSWHAYPGFDLEHHFVEGGIDLYLAGHEHVFQYHNSHGIHNVGCGASGGDARPGQGFYQGRQHEHELDWVGKGNDYGFVVIEVFPMELIIRFVDIQLIILKEIVISKPLPSHQSSS